MSSRLSSLLVHTYPEKHVGAFVSHYSDMVDSFQKSDWEKSIAKSGKFIEAVLKALYLHVGNTLPPARQFKVGSVVASLKQLPVGSFVDAIRITIPRACEFIYDIASNRGARHDPDEVNPNEGDAHVALACSSWILAELLRCSQKDRLSQEETKELIGGLVQRRYPIIEEVDGRTYFHIPNLSARQIALLVLWQRYPARLDRVQIMDTLERHRVTHSNASTALARIAPVIDIDQHGRMRLLRPGIIEAEKIIESTSKK